MLEAIKMGKIFFLQNILNLELLQAATQFLNTFLGSYTTITSSMLYSKDCPQQPKKSDSSLHFRFCKCVHSPTCTRFSTSVCSQVMEEIK